jgi:NAD(P)-dependent dehydrogenase (short-subunit alcohol dehydrogenase family)/acyl carrier protein
VLAGLRGLDAPGAPELRDELAEAGTRATVVACDVTDRDAVAALLAEHPVTAVFHAAGVLDDGMLASMTAHQADRVLASKAVSADLLDELTRDRELSAFVLFSSIAGVLGGPGQGGYAAANAHLDALAYRRRATGLTATSVAWGPWGGDGMAATVLGSGTSQGQGRRGLRPLTPALAVAALQQALDQDETCLTVADIDWTAIAPMFTLMRPNPLISALPEVQRHAESTADRSGGALRERLAGLDPAARRQRLVETIQRNTTAVLGLRDEQPVRPTHAFKDLGFDSMTAVELRNSLGNATGLRLPATMVFDYPTPDSLAGYLDAELFGTETGTPLIAELDRLGSLLASTDVDDSEHRSIAARLRELLSQWSSTQDDAAVEVLESASDDEMFEFIGKEFGIS